MSVKNFNIQNEIKKLALADKNYIPNKLVGIHQDGFFSDTTKKSESQIVVIGLPWEHEKYGFSIDLINKIKNVAEKFRQEFFDQNKSIIDDLLIKSDNQYFIMKQPTAGLTSTIPLFSSKITNQEFAENNSEYKNLLLDFYIGITQKVFEILPKEHAAKFLINDSDKKKNYVGNQNQPSTATSAKQLIQNEKLPELDKQIVNLRNFISVFTGSDSVNLKNIIKFVSSRTQAGLDSQIISSDAAENYSKFIINSENPISPSALLSTQKDILFTLANFLEDNNADKTLLTKLMTEHFHSFSSTKNHPELIKLSIGLNHKKEPRNLIIEVSNDLLDEISKIGKCINHKPAFGAAPSPVVSTSVKPQQSTGREIF